MGMEIEVLLPSFLLGCMIKKEIQESVEVPGKNWDTKSTEELAGHIVSGAFMLLVGFSMPTAFGANVQIESSLEPIEYGFHVLIVTLLSNIGKMFPCFCYRNEATLKERLAVSVAMFPRGEVGAGILALSLSYGINGPHVAVAFMSLALNLILTAVFILIVKKLLDPSNGTTSDQLASHD